MKYEINMVKFKIIIKLKKIMILLKGLGTNPTAQNPKENIYTVENEQINLSLR